MHATRRIEFNTPRLKLANDAVQKLIYTQFSNGQATIQLLTATSIKEFPIGLAPDSIKKHVAAKLPLKLLLLK